MVPLLSEEASLYPSLQSGNLGQDIEMLIAGIQQEIVLHDERRNPQVVRGYWGPLVAELTKQARVMMRCLVIGEQYPDTR